MEKGNESRGGAERRMAGKDRDEAQCRAALLIETPDCENKRLDACLLEQGKARVWIRV